MHSKSTKISIYKVTKVGKSFTSEKITSYYDLRGLLIISKSSFATTSKAQFT